MKRIHKFRANRDIDRHVLLLNEERLVIDYINKNEEIIRIKSKQKSIYTKGGIEI